MGIWQIVLFVLLGMPLLCTVLFALIVRKGDKR